MLDVVNGYILLAQSNNSGAWNFGPMLKKTFKVKNILAEIKKKNVHLNWKFEEPTIKQESINLNLDTKKAQKMLKWKPKWDINKTLEQTNNWYNQYYSNKNIKKFTINQIMEFYNL